MKKWTNEEKEFLIRNYKEIGLKKCSEYLLRTPKAVQHKICQLNLIVIKEWSKDEICILTEKYSKMNIKDLSLLLNRTIKAIRYKAGELGLKVDKTLIGKRISITKLENTKTFDKFKVNPDIFINNLTPESVYILGMLWADGYLIKNSIYLWLKKDDAESISDIFARTGNWNIYYRKLKNRKEQMCFFTSNKFIYNFLIENDYKNKSTVNQNKILYLIPDELKKYFFRGYFDGDGSIYNKIGNILNITSTYNQDWTCIENLLNKLKINKFNLRRTKYLSKENKLYKMSRIVISNRLDIVNFCSYIYDNFEIDKIGFERKFKIYKAVEKKIKNNINI